MTIPSTQGVSVTEFNHTVDVVTPYGTVRVMLYANSDRVVISVEPDNNSHLWGVVGRRRKNELANGFSVIMMPEDEVVSSEATDETEDETGEETANEA